MSIVAVHNGPGATPQRSADVEAPSTSTSLCHGVNTERAHRLLTAIEHHRAALAELLNERLRHVAELHAEGWQPLPIGLLYKLTRERARQLVVASTRTDSEVES